MVRTIQVIFVEEVIHILTLQRVRIRLLLQKLFKMYVLHWYHSYILHPRMDRMEAMTCQHLYWPGIRKSVRKEVKMMTLVNVQNNQI